MRCSPALPTRGAAAPTRPTEGSRAGQKNLGGRIAVLETDLNHTARHPSRPSLLRFAPLGPPFPQPRRRSHTIIADVLWVARTFRGAG